MTLRRFVIHLLSMIMVLIGFIGGALVLLACYTNHGQEVVLENYVGKSYEEAKLAAHQNSFELRIKDSIHMVGQPGGVILTQNPAAYRIVKEDRKIYVEVSKYQPDHVRLDELPKLYGLLYSQAVTALSHIPIRTAIRHREYDAGSPNHILQVWYRDELICGAEGLKADVEIEKGSTLEFVLSKSDGGSVPVPNLVCHQYRRLGFLLKQSFLELGQVTELDEITDIENAWVVAQMPQYVEGVHMRMKDSIAVIVQHEQPESCKD